MTGGGVGSEDGAQAETMDTRWAMSEEKRVRGASGEFRISNEMKQLDSQIPHDQFGAVPQRIGRFLSEDSITAPSQVSRLAAA